MNLYQYPLHLIAGIDNPFERDVWGCGLMTEKLIEESLPKFGNWDDKEIRTIKDHASIIRHIAEKATNPEPVQIFVDKNPDDSYHKVVLGGHHTLCAAIWTKAKFVICDVFGDPSLIGPFTKLHYKNGEWIELNPI